MTIESIDHVEKALSRITDELNKPNFQKFVSLYAEQIQTVEDALLVLADMKSIDLAYGIWLDYIGKLAGLQREGRTDDQYRASLRVKISINNANGTPNDLIDLVKQYTMAGRVTIREGDVAWGVIYTNGQSNIDSTLWDLIQDIRPVSTRWVIHTDYHDNAFVPSWEVTQTATEIFQTTDDGVTYENFQTSEDLISYEDFFTTSLSSNDLGGVNNRNYLAWENGVTEPFYVDTGSSVEPLTLVVDSIGTEDTLDVLIDLIPDEEERPLCWEVFSYSTQLID